MAWLWCSFVPRMLICGQLEAVLQCLQRNTAVLYTRAEKQCQLVTVTRVTSSAQKRPNVPLHHIETHTNRKSR